MEGGAGVYGLEVQDKGGVGTRGRLPGTEGAFYGVWCCGAMSATNASRVWSGSFAFRTTWSWCLKAGCAEGAVEATMLSRSRMCAIWLEEYVAGISPMESLVLSEMEVSSLSEECSGVLRCVSGKSSISMAVVRCGRRGA
jgi:hypothetical protein